mmetsp:Transcript_12383/g.32370  ORF Transcript_12383/g.32370 Transcript_12383/m.32370 type:complete len:623 (+) Transcript_12383:114-1982(+)
MGAVCGKAAMEEKKEEGAPSSETTTAPVPREAPRSANPKKIVIIGAVAGGASAAARARRLDERATIVMIEKAGDPSIANCGMPYWLGGEIKERGKLNVQTPASLKARLDLDVKIRTEAIAIDKAAKTVRVREVNGGREYDETYDELVLSLGAKPFLPPIPGIERPGNLSLRNLDDMDEIHNWITRNEARTAVVCGGGFIGVEMAEQLHKRGLRVTLVEALPQLMAPFDPEMANMLAAEMERNGVSVKLGAAIKGFEASASGAKASDVVLGGANGGDPQRVPADVVILGLGVRADTSLPERAGIKLNARGGIVVDECMRTSEPHIWAVGDAVEVANPVGGGQWMVALAGPANRQGRLCADMICGLDQKRIARKYAGTFGTSAVRVFELDAASTGLNERGAKAASKMYDCVHLHPSSHAGYFPGAEVVSLKILFDTSTGAERGRVLGAQAVGKDGIDKRIDVLATAIQAKMTVDDIAELELCYAPPFGTAKDPVNYAGMIAQDMLDGLVQTVQWHELPKLATDPEVVVLDVRAAKEIETAGQLVPTAINIPLDEIRSRLDELPRHKAIITSCLSGQRAYYAARILAQSGFTVRNLDGAFKTFSQSGLRVSPTPPRIERNPTGGG